MPSEFEEIFAGSQSFYEESEGQVFSWKGVDYQCSAGDVTLADDYSDAGLRKRRRVEITATVAQFTAGLPQAKDPIVYLGDTYVVDPERGVDVVALHFVAYAASGA